MFENLVGRKCKIVMESVGLFRMHGWSHLRIFGVEILEERENFLKVRILDNITEHVSSFETVKVYEEDEETYLNLKNIVSISEL